MSPIPIKRRLTMPRINRIKIHPPTILLPPRPRILHLLLLHGQRVQRRLGHRIRDDNRRRELRPDGALDRTTAGGHVDYARGGGPPEERQEDGCYGRDGGDVCVERGVEGVP